MEMEQYEIYRHFKNNEEKTIKVRTHNGDLRDKVYRGLLKKDFLNDKQGETLWKRGEIKSAIRKNYLEERVISMNGTHRVVFIYKGQEMLTKWGFKLWFQLFSRKLSSIKEKIVKFFNV